MYDKVNETQSKLYINANIRNSSDGEICISDEVYSRNVSALNWISMFLLGYGYVKNTLETHRYFISWP